MMVNIALFNILLGLVVLHALWRGGAPERWVAAGFLLAAAVTRARYAATGSRYITADLIVMAIDLALLAALLIIALRANRLWPMPVAALQLSAVAVHFAKLIDPAMADWTYAFMSKFWSYFMLAALVSGTFRHSLRLRKRGIDSPWS